MRQPKVSICIPNYNYAEFLGLAVQSVLEQSWSDYEIIVVDDASRDDSWLRLQQFSDERLHVYRNEKNLGRVANINKALSLANGDYVSVLPSDGYLMPESLSQRVACLEENPGVVLTYCAVKFINESGETLGDHIPYQNAYVRPGTEEFRALIGRNYIYTISALMRRREVKKIGLLDESVSPAHRDWHLFLRLATAGDFAYVPETLVAERRHPGNFTEKIAGTEILQLSQLFVLEAIFDELRRAGSGLARMHNRAFRRAALGGISFALGALADGDRVRARTHLALSMRAYPKGSWYPFFLTIRTLTALPRWLLKFLPLRVLQAAGNQLFSRPSHSKVRRGSSFSTC